MVELSVEDPAGEVPLVEVGGLDVPVAGRVVEVVLDGTAACGLDGAPEGVVVVGCSSPASAEISLLCFAISPSSAAISLASDAAVAVGETVVVGLPDLGPVWPDWITLVALWMSAAAAATLWCEEASSALLSHLFTEAMATSALWYLARPEGWSARSRLAPAVTPTSSVMMAATRSLAWLRRRAARMARAVARTSVGPLWGSGGTTRAARSLPARPASSSAVPSALGPAARTEAARPGTARTERPSALSSASAAARSSLRGSSAFTAPPGSGAFRGRASAAS